MLLRRTARRTRALVLASLDRPLSTTALAGLHVNFLWNDPADAPKVSEGLEQLFRAVVAMRGTLSGEHGIGTSKSEYLHLEQSEALIDLQRRLKAVFDPKGLLNPHKIFPDSLVCVEARAPRRQVSL